jgi:predicted dehydrogenase
MGQRRKRIGMGLVGPGFIAPHHIDAVRRLGYIDVIAIAGSSQSSAERKAEQLDIDRAYGSYLDLINDPDIDVVHNTTPSYMHFPISMATIKADKHIISDKPLAVTPDECAQLSDAAAAAGVVNAVTFNYRGNPLVQQARLMVAEQNIGALNFVHGYYLQDWMTDANVYSWRSDPTKNGVSSALADIGSHWCDLAEHISGSTITAVLADLTTVVKTRYSAGGSAEAFSANVSAERRPIAITSEDLASVLVRFANGAKGCFSVGQVAPGHKNDLQIEFNGRAGSLRWIQERQNELWIGRHDQPNAVMLKDPASLLPAARPYAHLPAGHQEAWSDAFRNVIGDIYTWIVTGEKGPTISTFADGYRISRVIQAMLKSNEAGGTWQPVEVQVNA